MKVRSKVINGKVQTLYGRAEIEVLGEEAAFYLVSPQRIEEGYFYALPKTHWEPVPTETWRDVTAEMEVNTTNDSYFGYKGGKAVGSIFGGYRLRKVQVWARTSNTEMRDAFIIEKREP